MKSLFSSPGSSSPAPLAPSPPIPTSPSTPSPSLAPAPAPSPGLTLNEVKSALPPHMRASATQGLVDTLNAISTDQTLAEAIRDNFISYAGVMKDGKFKLDDYLHAVAYVSHKLMGDSNQDAYARTFPQRYAALVAKGLSAKDISAYVSAYAKGKLVNLIMEQTLVPAWVLHQHLYNDALAVQAKLMHNATSEKVRTDAANSILTHLKRPDAIKGQLDVNVAETAGMKELKDLFSRVAHQQQTLIAQGEMKTIDVAAQRLVETTVDGDFRASDFRGGVDA